MTLTILEGRDMSATPEQRGPETRELDLKTDFNEILEAGYTINLWNTGGSVRVAEILRRGEPMADACVDKLGFGSGATAIEALARALGSYHKREQEDKEAMTQDDMREAEGGYLVGGKWDGTYLDAIAQRSQITFYYDDDEYVVAEIPTLTFGQDGKATARGLNMAQAIDHLEQISGWRIH